MAYAYLNDFTCTNAMMSFRSYQCGPSTRPRERGLGDTGALRNGPGTSCLHMSDVLAGVDVVVACLGVFMVFIMSSSGVFVVVSNGVDAEKLTTNTSTSKTMFSEKESVNMIVLANPRCLLGAAAPPPAAPAAP